MDEIQKMKSSSPPSIPRSASEAELLKHVGSENNLVNLAAESDSIDKNDAMGDETLTSVQDQGTNSQREAVEEKEVLSYGSYCAKCPNSSKKQRIEAIQAFYNSLQNA